MAERMPGRDRSRLSGSLGRGKAVSNEPPNGLGRPFAGDISPWSSVPAAARWASAGRWVMVFLSCMTIVTTCIHVRRQHSDDERLIHEHALTGPLSDNHEGAS